MNRRHVCFVAPYIFPTLVPNSGLPFAGGAEMQQALIARMLVREGYRVSALCRDFGQPALTLADGVELHRLPDADHRGLPGLRWLTPRLTDVARMLAKLNPHVVYVRTTTAYTTSAAWYARTRDRCFVFSGASDKDFARGRDRSISRRDWALFRLGLRFADRVLAQHRAQANDAKENLGIDADICPNFLTEMPNLTANPTGPVVWVGSLSPVKQPLQFVELARRLPALRFEMIGGPQRDAQGLRLAEELASEAAGVPNLLLRGHVPPADVGRMFDGASALANTSRMEGFPNTFLQAWARGVPSLSFVNPESAAGWSGTMACDGIDDMQARLSELTSNALLWQRQSAHVLEVFQLHHTESAAQVRYRRIFAPPCQT